VDLGTGKEGPSPRSSIASSKRICRRLLYSTSSGAGEIGSSKRLKSRVLLCERVRGPEEAATSSKASAALDWSILTCITE
jgi:hypothetical protein